MNIVVLIFVVLVAIGFFVWVIGSGILLLRAAAKDVDRKGDATSVLVFFGTLAFFVFTLYMIVSRVILGH